MGQTAPTIGLPELPHFAPKAKRAIYLFMAGALSQMDMFDYKPNMVDMFDVDLPESIHMGQRLTTMTSGQDRFPLTPSIFKFRQHGKSGAWISELLPHTAEMVDDLAIIRSVHTEAINHDPAITYICTGVQLPGKPSLGSWLSYGLGSKNQQLPSFVVMTSSWTGRNEAQALYNRLWAAVLCRPSTKVSRSGRAAIRCCFCRTPMVFRLKCSGKCSTRSGSHPRSQRNDPAPTGAQSTLDRR
jgi:hypothetical protein